MRLLAAAIASRTRAAGDMTDHERRWSVPPIALRAVGGMTDHEGRWSVPPIAARAASGMTDHERRWSVPPTPARMAATAISAARSPAACPPTPSTTRNAPRAGSIQRSEEHTSELQSLTNLVCRLLLEKKN